MRKTHVTCCERPKPASPYIELAMELAQLKDDHAELLRQRDQLRAELAKERDCCTPPAACPKPSPCQCNQQLIDIIGNLVAVLRERS